MRSPLEAGKAQLCLALAALLFSCAPPEIQYGSCNAIALPPLPGHDHAEAHALNDIDPPAVVGTSFGDGEERAVMWTFDSEWEPSVTALPLPKGAAGSYARGVNDRDDVVGAARSGDGQQGPILWRGGTPALIDVPGGTRRGVALAVSAAGAVAGTVLREPSPVPPQPSHPYRGFLIPDDGGMGVSVVRLDGVVDRDGVTFAAGAGARPNTSYPELPVVIGSNGYWRALADMRGRAHALTALTAHGYPAFFVAGAQRNDQGVLTAATWLDYGTDGPAIGQRYLEVPAGASYSAGHDVNGAQAVAGVAFLSDGPRAFTWDAEGTGSDLNDALWPACAGTLQQAHGLNEAGRVVGVWERPGGRVGFLFDPQSVALRPRIRARKTGPDQARLLDPFDYRFTLTNGDSVERVVVLTDDPHEPDAGLVLATGSESPAAASAGGCARSGWRTTADRAMETEVTLPAESTCSVSQTVRVVDPAVARVFTRREDYHLQLGDEDPVLGDAEVVTVVAPPPPPWTAQLLQHGPGQIYRNTDRLLVFTVEVDRWRSTPLRVFNRLPPELSLAQSDWSEASDGTVSKEFRLDPGETTLQAHLRVHAPRDAAIGPIVNDDCWVEADGMRLADCEPLTIEVVNNPPRVDIYTETGASPAAECSQLPTPSSVQLMVAATDLDDSPGDLEVEIFERGAPVTPLGVFPGIPLYDHVVLPLSGLGPGEHCLAVSARDPAGAEAAPVYRCFLVGASAQTYTVSALALPAGATESRALDLDETGRVGGSAGGEPCVWDDQDQPVCQTGYRGAVIDLDQTGRALFLLDDASASYYFGEPAIDTVAIYPDLSPMVLAQNGVAVAARFLLGDLVIFAHSRGQSVWSWIPYPYHDPTCALTSRFDLNSHGSVAGFYDYCGPNDRIYWPADSPREFLPPNWFPTAVNDAEQLAGWVVQSDGTTHATRWTDRWQLVPEDIHTFGTGSRAWEMNDFGRVVGTATVAPGAPPAGQSAPDERRALLHDCFGTVDLNDRIPPDSGWVLEEARAIGNSGEIVGSGTYQGATRAFRLRPTSP